MNDVVVSSLLNLFALIGARNDVEKSKAESLIHTYLKYCFGIQKESSYSHLYSDLRDYYDEFPDLDKDSVIDGICNNLKSRVSVE